MRVLITGGAGFFGSRAALHFKDAEIHLVDRVGQDWARVKGLDVRGERHEVDLLDAGAVRAVVEKVRPDVLVHLAWYAVPGKYLQSDENFPHVNASTSLFLAARDVGCKRFCGAGTCLEYDTSGGVLREDSPTKPESIYAATKLATYLLLDRAAKQYGISFAWMRFFYPYGPFESQGRLVSTTLAELLAGRPAKTTPGAQLRDFMHIDDVGRAIAMVATSKLEGVVNVASGTGVSVRDMVSELATALDKTQLLDIGAVPYRVGDPMQVQADIAKLKSTGFAPRFAYKDGLRDTIEWARTRSGAAGT